MGKGQELYNRAKQLIPGGTQLLSKRPEMFLPNLWPSYYKKAKRCVVIDLDDNKYIDCSYMGIGACILGYADKDIDVAVKDAVDKGNMTTLNVPEEVELAEILLDIHKWADCVRYARTGGEATSIAVRIARAYSGKDKIMFCGYHGWHDWYLSANLAKDSALDGHLLSGLEPKGVPRALTGNAIPFEYNKVEAFKEKFEKHVDEIGVIVMEPVRNFAPEKEFISIIEQYSKQYNIPLVVDEITAGFRLNKGGAHLLYGLHPDIAIFAKGMSNGYPMAAIIGKKDIMNTAQVSFISSTYWTDRIGPAAAIATIKKMMANDVQDHIVKMGKKVQDGWKRLSDKHGLNLHTSGLYPLSHFGFEKDPLHLKTLFTQLMLEKGYLATTAFYLSYAHTDEIIDKYINACDEVFAVIAKSIKNDNYKDMLKGPVCHSGFQRLN